MPFENVFVDINLQVDVRMINASSTVWHYENTTKFNNEQKLNEHKNRNENDNWTMDSP